MQRGKARKVREPARRASQAVSMLLLMTPPAIPVCRPLRLAAPSARTDLSLTRRRLYPGRMFATSLMAAAPPCSAQGTPARATGMLPVDTGVAGACCVSVCCPSDPSAFDAAFGSPGQFDSPTSRGRRSSRGATSREPGTILPRAKYVAVGIEEKKCQFHRTNLTLGHSTDRRVG